MAGRGWGQGGRFQLSSARLGDRHADGHAGLPVYQRVCPESQFSLVLLCGKAIIIITLPTATRTAIAHPTHCTAKGRQPHVEAPSNSDPVTLTIGLKTKQLVMMAVVLTVIILSFGECLTKK